MIFISILILGILSHLRLQAANKTKNCVYLFAMCRYFCVRSRSLMSSLSLSSSSSPDLIGWSKRTFAQSMVYNLIFVASPGWNVLFLAHLFASSHVRLLTCTAYNHLLGTIDGFGFCCFFSVHFSMAITITGYKCRVSHKIVYAVQWVLATTTN